MAVHNGHLKGTNLLLVVNFENHFLDIGYLDVLEGDPDHHFVISTYVQVFGPRKAPLYALSNVLVSSYTTG